LREPNNIADDNRSWHSLLFNHWIYIKNKSMVGIWSKSI